MNNAPTTSSSSESPAEISGDILELFENPMQLILQGGKYGIKGVGKFFLILILFAILNFLILLYAIYREAVATIGDSSLTYLILVVIMGIVATAYAGFRAYQYVRNDALRVAYEKVRPYFPGFCRRLVDRVMDKKVDLDSPNVKSALDTYAVFGQYFQRLPSFITKRLIRKLEKIPFVKFLQEAKQDLASGNREQAASRIYQASDGLLTEGFTKNNMRWVRWLLPLNIVVQILLLRQIV